MARYYTVKTTIRCWKEHICAGCGGVYAYRLVRTVGGAGGSEQAASLAAQKNAQSVAATELDMVPCPTCGLYQPDMIGKRRARWHRLTLWAALIPLVVALILYATDAMQAYNVSWIIIAVCGLAAMAFWTIDGRNPNADTDANLALVSPRVAEGSVLHQPAPSAVAIEPLARPSAGVLQRAVVLVLLPLAVLAGAMPELLRWMQGWPVNADTFPPVVGPGEEAKVYMNNQFESIKSYWRGESQAFARETVTGRLVPLATRANTNDWGNTISAKSDETSNSVTPWVRIELGPELTPLVGKTLEVTMDLQAEYPVTAGAGTFDVHQSTFSRKIAVRIAGPQAGQRYTLWWLTGSLSAVGVTLLSGALLMAFARALQRSAPPARVFTDPQPTSPPVVPGALPPGM